MKVTQNWSLEAKIMFADTVKIGARMVKIGARFWLQLEQPGLLEKSAPEW